MQKGMEKGMQKGMEKGMQKGMEIGMEIGMEKGILGLYKYEKNIDVIAKELEINKEKVLYILEKNGIKVKND
jgi:flagellar biosynthesis/type III secretory pathway protein FliH